MQVCLDTYASYLLGVLVWWEELLLEKSLRLLGVTSAFNF